MYFQTNCDFNTSVSDSVKYQRQNNIHIISSNNYSNLCLQLQFSRIITDNPKLYRLRTVNQSTFFKLNTLRAISASSTVFRAFTKVSRVDVTFS